MTKWKEITKEEFIGGVEPKNDYSTLLEMWRQEKKKRQDAENEIALIKRIGIMSPEFTKLQQEIEALKKNFQIEREVHQNDIMIKDKEIGRLIKKISLKS